MADPRLQKFTADAAKVLDHLHAEFSRLQTGRANAALVEHVDVEAYGGRQKLMTLAGISVQDGRTIVVQPWDPGTLQAVEQALQKADLGANPTSDGSVIRIVLPQMTEERREHLVKQVNVLAEEAKISIRHSRQESHQEFKDEKDEDVRETLQTQLQKLVDEANTKIEDSKKKKEQEVMTI